MAFVQLPLSARPDRNQQLFSDNYLDAILPELPEWRQAESRGAETLESVCAILASFHPSSNEAQTERELIQPVLEALGHTFEGQPALHVPGGTQRPDCVFFRDEQALNTLKERVLDDTLLAGTAIAVGDTKYWDRPLDQAPRAPGTGFDNRNPGYQISFYMQQTGLRWGILTNSRLWRLYNKEFARKLDRFYEVDLAALVGRGRRDAFA